MMMMMAPFWACRDDVIGRAGVDKEVVVNGRSRLAMHVSGNNRPWRAARHLGRRVDLGIVCLVDVYDGE